MHDLQKNQISVEIPPGFAENHKKSTVEQEDLKGFPGNTAPFSDSNAPGPFRAHYAHARGK